MSMPVDHIKALFLASLPLICLAGAVGAAVYLGSEVKKLATGTTPLVYQALEKVPEQTRDIQMEPLSLTDNTQKRDPFLRPEPARQPEEKTVVTRDNVVFTEIHLSSTASGKNGSYCLINGKIFYENQRGDGFTVGPITTDRVIFHTAVQSFSLAPGQKTAIQGGRVVPYEQMRKSQQEHPGEIAPASLQTIILKN